MEKTVHLDLAIENGRTVARSQPAIMKLDPTHLGPGKLWKGLIVPDSRELSTMLARDPHGSTRLHAQTRDGRELGVLVFQEFFPPVPGRELGSARFEFRGELPA